MTDLFLKGTHLPPYLLYVELMNPEQEPQTYIKQNAVRYNYFVKSPSQEANKKSN